MGRLDAEDLARWRQVQVRIDAIQVKPDGYSTEQIEQAYMQRYRMSQEFIDKYGLDDTENLVFAIDTGAIQYEDD